MTNPYQLDWLERDRGEARDAEQERLREKEAPGEPVPYVEPRFEWKRLGGLRLRIRDRVSGKTFEYEDLMDGRRAVREWMTKIEQRS